MARFDLKLSPMRMFCKYISVSTLLAFQLYWRFNFIGVSTLLAFQLYWRFNFIGVSTLLAFQLSKMHGNTAEHGSGRASRAEARSNFNVLRTPR